MSGKNFEYREQQLDQLFERYKEACGDPEPGVNFMPGLWQKIEARQPRINIFARPAKSLFAGATVLSLALMVFLLAPSGKPSIFSQGSYVEALATDNANEEGAFFEPVRLELMAMESNGR